MVEINELTKRYEDGVLALDHATYKVEQGEIFCLLGANGAGKTTTINILLDFIQQAAQEFLDTVHVTKQLPSIIWVAGEPMLPEDFAVTLASLVAAERYSGNIPMQQGELEAKQYVSDDSPRLWGWVIFLKGFDAPHMMEIAKLQAWTIKPAALRK